MHDCDFSSYLLQKKALQMIKTYTFDRSIDKNKCNEHEIKAKSEHAKPNGQTVR